MYTVLDKKYVGDGGLCSARQAEGAEDDEGQIEQLLPPPKPQVQEKAHQHGTCCGIAQFIRILKAGLATMITVIN